MKKHKKAIGYALVASPFLAGFLICGFVASWVMAFSVFGGSALVTGAIVLGVNLIID